MSTVNTLKAARNLLEKGWTQGTYARDKNGASVDYRDPEACSFCISGVLKKVARGSAGHGVAVYNALDRHIPDPNPSYPMWNDDPCRKIGRAHV